MCCAWTGERPSTNRCPRRHRLMGCRVIPRLSVKSASTSSPASVRGERFCLLSAGLLPGVRSPDRLYWFKRIPVDWCRTSTAAGGRRVALRGRDHAWPSLEWHSSAVAIAWFDGRRQAAMPRTESTMASKVFCDITISADGYVALRISPGRCYCPMTSGEAPMLPSVPGGRARFA